MFIQLNRNKTKSFFIYFLSHMCLWINKSLTWPNINNIFHNYNNTQPHLRNILNPIQKTLFLPKVILIPHQQTHHSYRQPNKSKWWDDFHS